MHRGTFLLLGTGSGGAQRKVSAVQATVVFVAWQLIIMLLCGHSAGAAALAAQTSGFRSYTHQYDYNKSYTGSILCTCLKVHFPQVSPASPLVSYASEETLQRTSAGAVVNFLLGAVNTSQVLTARCASIYYNFRLSQTEAFANQIVTQFLPSGSDLAGAGFKRVGTALRNGVATSSPRAGKTLAQANLAMSGCSNAYLVDQLRTVAASTNQGAAWKPVRALPSRSVVCSVVPPGAVAPLTYCQGSAASPLSNGYTPLAGASLLLYASAVANTPLVSTYVPATKAVGTTTYYASQVVGNCESARTPLTVTVVAPPRMPTPIAALAINGSNIAAWGDSFTDSNYGRYPQTLAQLSSYAVYNGGVGGQTSVQVKDRMVADVAKHTWPTIIWVGRNDAGNPAQVQASIAAMVAALAHTDYLVLSVCNGEGEGKGTAAYGQITTLNSALAQTYGRHYLNVRSYLVSEYDPNDAQDTADYTADIPPHSLRQDFLHPNVAGSDLIAQYVYANFGRILGGSLAINYCWGAPAAPLGNSLSPVAAGATLRFYASPTGGAALGAGPRYAPDITTVGTQMYYVAQVVGTCESDRLPLAVVVRNCSATAFASNAPGLSAYPNPFGGQATVEVNLPSTQSYTLELYDGTGKLVQRLAVDETGQRINYYINAPSLPEGLYVVRLSAGSASQSLHLILSK
ncbi:hypothetical protein BEN49_05515 [Hymenobacter coccineus]|uniref:Secretion system C-terminal sorting domain-containing protein n=2 Tax=Hymenobacter coccineus TaxID=1908235 RepID=A0A1G1TJQ5_9BACT|nr:hypothetical protein BEN49_05515 [Hymenobacter coccineus]